MIELEVDWILHNIFPEDYLAYIEFMPELSKIPINENIDYWRVVKIAMFLDPYNPEFKTTNRDALYDVYLRIVNGDFNSFINPIKIVNGECWNGHHRIIAAWMSTIKTLSVELT